MKIRGKKGLALILAMVMFFVMTGTVMATDTIAYASEANNGGIPVSSETIVAKYANSTVIIDGKVVEFEAYTINNNTYFKLRDLAMALNGTVASFSVEWVVEYNCISIERGSYTGTVNEAYTPVGGELQKGDGKDKIARISTQVVNAPMDGGVCRAYDNGEVIGWSAYNINNNNYFKLRDIGQLFEFEVDWDGEKNCIIIDTTKPYTED